jgi:hypothetical protein
MAYNGPFPQVVAAGGTGDVSLDLHGVLLGQGTNSIAIVDTSPTAGLAFISNGSSSNPGYGVVAPVGGGTGVNNSSNTITLSGNLVTSGNNSLTLTTTGPTNVNLPTSGTLATISGLQTYSPTIGDGTTNFTMSSQIGQYYQIGPLYYVIINLSWSNINGVSTGSVRISLPTSITQNRVTFPIAYAQGVTWGGVALSCIGDVSENYIRLSNNLAGSMTDLGSSAYSNGGGEVIITGWFS